MFGPALVKLVYTCIIVGSMATEFEKVFEWKQLSHAKLPDFNKVASDGIPRLLGDAENEIFQAYNNVPMGATHHKNRVFISIPRRRPGVPATLNVIDLSKVVKGDRSPALSAYPSYLTNALKPGFEADLNRLVSVYRTRVDACERLWFVDTGMVTYPDRELQVQRPQLWIIDLKRDKLFHRYTIPKSIVAEGVGMVSLAVDVEQSNCSAAFAYIPDLIENAIYVYSLQDDDMWSYKHSSFAYDRARANFHVAGHRFEWDDGVFSIAVGPHDPATGSKLIFYHPMVSTTEFGTTASVLQNKSIALSNNYEGLFHPLGDRGPNTQSTMHHYDSLTGVMFYAEVNRNSIGCWNTTQGYGADNHAVVHLDNRELIYPSDLNSDANGTLWVLTNTFPVWLYSRLNDSDYNYRLWRQNSSVAIQGTKCEN
ncbi:L-dopachrome tautomerase yellow-f-like [Anopheles cruzii]|uniref:L-dopachrome tautomerase yellow-f-like n=1 Tax=Anopheles cruzii TaxID=68878 RepID=UPI0022EC883F|nr:L-dopachrome tautomerase yellow-f-like [Anopheles cruzii]